jgi:hypothetical protein
MTRGFEAVHRALSVSGGLMRVLRAVVQALVLALVDTRHDFLFGSSVAGQFVGNDNSRDVLEAFEQCAEELFRGLRGSRRLCDPHIEHNAMLVNGPPQLVLFASDFQEHLIQMPCVSRPAAMALQLIGVGLTKFQAPLPNRFVGQHNAALCQELFDLTETEREANRQPHTVTNNLRRETEPFGEGS